MNDISAIAATAEKILKVLDAEIPQEMDQMVSDFLSIGAAAYILHSNNAQAINAIKMAAEGLGVPANSMKGEYAVGVGFNPSGSGEVYLLKRAAAGLIDMVNVAGDPNVREVGRLQALARTSFEEGAMWAVKAATKGPSIAEEMQGNLIRAAVIDAKDRTQAKTEIEGAAQSKVEQLNGKMSPEDAKAQDVEATEAMEALSGGDPVTDGHENPPAAEPAEKPKAKSKKGKDQ